MINKALLLGIASALLCMLILYFGEDKRASTFLYMAQQIANGLGLILLIRNSRLYKSVYFNIIIGLHAFVTIGIMFKIMHWPFAGPLLLGSLSLVATTYLVWFIKKENKNNLDLLKLLWVFTAYVGAGLFLVHLIPRKIIEISPFIFWLCVLDFVYFKWKERTLFDK